MRKNEDDVWSETGDSSGCERRQHIVHHRALKTITCAERPRQASQVLVKRYPILPLTFCAWTDSATDRFALLKVRSSPRGSNM